MNFGYYGTIPLEQPGVKWLTQGHSDDHCRGQSHDLLKALSQELRQGFDKSTMHRFELHMNSVADMVT